LVMGATSSRSPSYSRTAVY